MLYYSAEPESTLALSSLHRSNRKSLVRPLPQHLRTTKDYLHCYSCLSMAAVNPPAQAVAAIPPGGIAAIMQQVEVPGPDNPNNCPCGWYEFYSAVCHHLYTRYKHHCGARTLSSGASGFCHYPAPSHIVKLYLIDRQCTRAH